MKSNVLNQYKSECREALNSTAKLSKTFEKVFMDVMPLYMTIHGRVNFLQMGRYGDFSEQTYRNNFENDEFDRMAFNSYIADKVLTGQRRAIAIDPSYIPKAGKKTPWIGYFPALGMYDWRNRSLPTQPRGLRFRSMTTQLLIKSI